MYSVLYQGKGKGIPKGKPSHRKDIKKVQKTKLSRGSFLEVLLLYPKYTHYLYLDTFNKNHPYKFSACSDSISRHML